MRVEVTLSIQHRAFSAGMKSRAVMHGLYISTGISKSALVTSLSTTFQGRPTEARGCFRLGIASTVTLNHWPGRKEAERRIAWSLTE
jgi:hypothetical protein